MFFDHMASLPALTQILYVLLKAHSPVSCKVKTSLQICLVCSSAGGDPDDGLHLRQKVWCTITHTTGAEHDGDFSTSVSKLDWKLKSSFT